MVTMCPRGTILWMAASYTASAAIQARVLHASGVLGFSDLSTKRERMIDGLMFDALDSSGFLQIGPLVLGGALRMSCQESWMNGGDPNVDVTVSIGVEVNRQVRVTASAT